MNPTKSFDVSLMKYMRKAAHPSDDMESSDPRYWRGECLQQQGDGVC